MSDEPTDARTLDEYGLRFDIEEAFLDEKSGGYQIHISEVATPEALEHLLLIILPQIPFLFSPHIEMPSARATIAISQWLCKQERFFRQIRFVSQTAIS
jgi:hypothetical protein